MIVEKKPEDIKQILKNATELELKGRIKEAIAEIERVVQLNPNDGNLYNRLGDLYIKINKIKDAVEIYRKGIDAFRNDNFYRNALALCKKVMRYDPGNLDVNLMIAKLLVDLDEKSDAMVYLFSYIERQMAAGNKREVMQAMEYMKQLKISDKRATDKMAQIYKSVGEEEAAAKLKRQEEKREAIVEKEVKIPEPSKPSFITEEEPAVTIEYHDLKEDVGVIEKEEERIKEDIVRLNDAVKEIERVLMELRKAIRLDEIIIALDKSLATLSNEQKTAIGLLQKSLNLNLETLQKSIKELHQSSEKNTHAVELLLNDLNKALTNLNENQEFLTQEIGKNLEKVGGTFDTATKETLTEIKKLVNSYQKATDDMCGKLDETKKSSLSLLKVSEDIKTSLQSSNDSLLRFMMAQESRDKKLWRFIMILIGSIAVVFVIILLLISK